MRAVFSILLVLLFSCNGAVKPPRLPLSQDRMVDVMVDLHLVETANNLKITEGDSTRPDYEALLAAVFSKHGLTQSEFDTALYRYSFYPKEMNVVYDRILERLSEMDAGAAARVSQSTAAELDAMNAHKR